MDCGRLSRIVLLPALLSKPVAGSLQGAFRWLRGRVQNIVRGQAADLHRPGQPHVKPEPCFPEDFSSLRFLALDQEARLMTECSLCPPVQSTSFSGNWVGPPVGPGHHPRVPGNPPGEQPPKALSSCGISKPPNNVLNIKQQPTPQS